MGAGKTYSREENEWLKEIYPTTGARETYAQFQIIFNRCPGWAGFKSHLSDLNLKVTKQRWRVACLNNGYHPNVPIGTIVTRGRGENWIKVSDGTNGWIPLKKHRIGNVPRGGMIIHLDGDKANDNAENLMVVDAKTSARLTGCDMWSKNAELTRTAIIWSNLVDALENTGGNLRYEEQAETTAHRHDS